MAAGPDSKAFYFMHGTLITSLKSEMLMDVSWMWPEKQKRKTKFIEA